jgi:hypothetical protein
MSEQLMKLVVDVSNGTEEYVPLNAEELAQYEIDKAAADAERIEREAEAAAKAAAKASALAKLEALGLTEAEALAIVGA